MTEFSPVLDKNDVTNWEPGISARTCDSESERLNGKGKVANERELVEGAHGISCFVPDRSSGKWRILVSSWRDSDRETESGTGRRVNLRENGMINPVRIR